MLRISLCLFLMLLAIGITACGSTNNGCDKDLPAPLTGSNGEKVSFSQLTDGSTVPCNGLQTGDICFFTVDFAAANVAAPATARLLVAITKTDKGADFCDNPFPQVSIPVTPGQIDGQLQGQLGPPVSTSVRFDLAIELLDATGHRISISNPIRNLRPG